MKHFPIIIIALFLGGLLSFSQESKKIIIKSAGSFNQDENRLPGAKILSSRGNVRVQLAHEGVDVWSDRAVYQGEKNFFRAYGNVILKQGDTVTMTSNYIEYDGNTKLAISREKVNLKTPEHTLDTDTLYFDRNKQQAYYRDGGTVRDSATTLKSKRGKYFLEINKYEFLSDVEIRNPEYELNSTKLDYYTDSKHAYMYGPSTIIGKEYDIYCERGFYDTEREEGFFIKNSTINYNNRKIQGDSLYFDNVRQFSSASNNITLTDTINKTIVRGHYAEVFKARDSAFITKRAVAINLIEQDSMYIHADTLMVTGPEDNRIIRGFRGVRFYKTDLSGKCDSIHVNQKVGITKLLRRPILWNGENQMTGDTVHLLSNVETEKLDSLKVINNAFVVQKDSLSDNGFNQVKGINLLGKFEENELKLADMVKNPEMIYYVYGDDGEFIGINKTICNIKIRMEMSPDEGIQDVTFFGEPNGDIFPDKDLPKNARRLRGFEWYGDERVTSKDDLFDEEDENIKLPKIQGVDQPFDFDFDEDLIDLESKKQEEEEKKRPPLKNTSKAIEPNTPKKPVQ